MKKFTLIAAAFALCGLVAAYSDMDDTLDVEALTKDKPRIQQLMDCFLDKQSGQTCTPQILGYKNHLTEAVSDGCKECNDVERHMLKVFIAALKSFIAKPDFEAFKAKFDPNGHIDTTFAEIARF